MKCSLTAFCAVSAVVFASPSGAFSRNHAPTAEPPPANAAPWVSESGTASYYGAPYHGRRTANGIRFDQMALTAAHRWLPFGTRVRVTLADHSRSIIVTITDRMMSRRRILDLSVGAARELGMIRRGVVEVTLVPA